MIKTKYNEEKDTMYIELEGKAGTLLEEYMATTSNLFNNIKIAAGKEEAKSAMKTAFKMGLKLAMKMEGECNE